MSIGFSGSFSALGATVGSKGGAGGGGSSGPAYNVSDVNFIYNQGSPAAVAYVAMPGGSRTFLSYITSFGVNQNSSNNDNSNWQNGYSGRLPLTAVPRANNNYFNGFKNAWSTVEKISPNFTVIRSKAYASNRKTFLKKIAHYTVFMISACFNIFL